MPTNPPDSLMRHSEELAAMRELTPLEEPYPVVLPCLPYLLCTCRYEHKWKQGLPWWSFKISEALCPECGEQIESVHFMGEHVCKPS